MLNIPLSCITIEKPFALEYLNHFLAAPQGKQSKLKMNVYCRCTHTHTHTLQSGMLYLPIKHKK